MKKILSLLIFSLIGICGWAVENASIDLTNLSSLSFSDFSKAGSTYTTQIQGPFPGSDGNTYGGWSKTDCMYNGNNHLLLQMKKTTGVLNTPTINSTNGFIVRVTYGSSKPITITIGNETATGNSGGSDTNQSNSVELETSLTSTTVKISSGSNAAYVSKIEFIPNSGTVIEKVKTPVISPESGTYETAQTVSITCETEDATILYKIDDAEYQEYNNPFVVNTNCTVYAKATKETMDDSNVATATYKFPLFISKLIDIYDLSVGDEFIFTDTVTCIDAQGRYLYVQDESGAALIYGAYGSDYQNTYVTTNVIPANWKGKISTYSGNKQITPTSELGQPLEGNDGQPIVRNIVATEIKTDITEVGNDLFKYCVIKKGILSATDPNGTRDNIVGDNLWIATEDGTHKAYTKTLGIEWIDENFDFSKEYDVYGVLGSYNGTPQLLPMGVVNGGTVTDNIDVVENSIKKVTYINAQGIQSSKPFDGLNIIVTEYENGTKKINKRIYKF